MSEPRNEIDQLTDHDYDGIREYNNPLPRWWLTAFVLCILFAGGYYYHYTFGNGPSLKDELLAALQDLEQRRTSAKAPELGSEELAKKIQSSDLKLAAEAFQQKCAACHGAELQGVIGPNLTDEFWIHGKGTAKDIVEIIGAGVPDKGMPTWSAVLKEDEIVTLAAFILSKQDSHPAGAKPPQGEKVR